MAINDVSVGDVNVFLSASSRGSGETPSSTATAASLLTFADMVLALGHENVVGDIVSRSFNSDGNSESDHTYASISSNASSTSHRTTRSQTAKSLSFSMNGENDQSHHSDLRAKEIMKSRSRPIVLDLDQGNSTDPRKAQEVRVKRSSSVETIQSIQDLELQSTNVSEWPTVFKSKTSPRKSCSVEEVNSDSHKSCIKTSKSSENIRTHGVSHQLHRLVNDTLEFPYWPRKADHTYATATWDGTAASHSLFEREMRQDVSSRVNEDQEMEVIELEQEVSMLKNFSEDGLQVSQCNLHNLVSTSPLPSQRDDHTYVKPKSMPSSHGSIFKPVSEKDISDDYIKRSFSSATFPRQKVQEDHTYFHSGLNKGMSGGNGGRGWTSAQSVMNCSIPSSNVPVQGTFQQNNHSFSRASARTDHNYSTSA